MVRTLLSTLAGLLFLGGTASAQVLIDFTNLVDAPGNGEIDGTEFRDQGLDLSTPPASTLNIGCGSPSCLAADLGVDDFGGSLDGDFIVPVTLENGVAFGPFEIDVCCSGFTPEDTVIRVYDAEDNLVKEALDTDLVYGGLTPISYFTIDFAADAMLKIEFEEIQAYDPDVVVFLDPLLTDTNWNALEIVDTTPGGAAFFTEAVQLTGGNPDAYRRVTHTYDSGTLVAGHFRSAATYTPSSDGSLSTVDYAFDAIQFNPPPGESVGLAPLLLQGGSYYAPTPVEISDAVWTSFSGTSLITADFMLVSGNGPANPDFSAAGSPLQFGILTSTASTSGPEFRELGFDNWRITLNKGPVILPTDVPALSPGARRLIALVLLVVGLVRYRAGGA